MATIKCIKLVGKTFWGRAMILWKRAWHLVALTMLSACSQLPLDGPANRDIVGGASAILVDHPRTAVYDYAFVDINPIVLDCLAEVEVDSFSKTFGGPHPGAPDQRGRCVGVGRLRSQAGGLFLPAGANNRQGNYVRSQTKLFLALAPSLSHMQG